MNDPSRLDGHVAVVTGGGTGIGAAIARLLAMHGADVVIAGRTLERLNSTADDIAMASGQQVLPVQTDVREEAAVIELVSRTIAEFGHLDVLVNNAGGSYMFPLLATSPERWDRSVSLNLRAPYLATYHALPHMLARQHGAIVNISSAAAVGGVRGGSAYASAKAGLQMFTRIVAAEHGPHGVRCNAIAVGTVASEGALRSWERFGQSVPELQSLIPLRRVGQPEDIAWGALYLASEMSSWVTGQLLVIDGGPMMLGVDIDE